jgi:hypothetical protein
MTSPGEEPQESKLPRILGTVGVVLALLGLAGLMLWQRSQFGELGYIWFMYDRLLTRVCFVLGMIISGAASGLGFTGFFMAGRRKQIVGRVSSLIAAMLGSLVFLGYFGPFLDRIFRGHLPG